MGRDNGWQLVDVEYCINKYFDENFAKVVDKSYGELRKKQGEEIGRRMKDGSGVAFQRDPLQVFRHVTSGEWTSKNTEHLLTMVNDRIYSNDTFCHDITQLQDTWRMAYIERYGQEQYDRLSSNVGMDLAVYYMTSRINSRVVERLAQKDVPTNSVAYILKEGFGNAFGVRALASWYTPQKSSLDAERASYARKLYDAGFFTKAAVMGTTFATDALTFGGYGSTATVAGKIAVGTFVSMDLFSAGSEAFAAGKDPSMLSSRQVFASDTAYSELKVKASMVNGRDSALIASLNDTLRNKMDTGGRPRMDKQKMVGDQRAIYNNVKGLGGMEAFGVFHDMLTENGLPFKERDRQEEVPQWMLARSEQANISQASMFMAMAEEMRQKGWGYIRHGNKTLSFEQVCQRVYDYAAAAAIQRQGKMEQAAARQQGASYQAAATPSVSASRPSVDEIIAADQQERQQAAVQQSPQSPQSQGTQAVGGQDFSAWRTLLDQAGLGGLTGLSASTLGSTIAMLPNLLLGMFTGKNKNMSMENCMLPLAALAMSMMLGRRHTMLKFLLLGYGAVSLLSKASEEVGNTREERVRSYNRVADEPLNARIKHVEVKDNSNSLLAEIDGTPVVITIDGRTMDAYRKGALPLNVLANNALRLCDEQGGIHYPHEQQQLSMQEGHERSIALR